MDAAIRSPWWYRQRALLIGLAFGLGFFLGNLAIDGRAPDPAFVTWGARFGAVGVRAFAWLGVGLVLIAWLVRAAGTAYLRREVVFSADALQDRLIVAGIFRFVRNPLYLGNVFLALGVGLYAPPLGFAIIVLGNIVIVALLAREEARHLALRYGESFAAYRRAVPSFVPRLTPANVPGSTAVAPSLGSAAIGEAGMLGTAIALMPVAAFGSAGLPALLIILSLALVVTFTVNGVRSRRTPGTAP